MQKIDEQEKAIQYKFNCINCNYHCNMPSDWLKHTKSKKHERGGEILSNYCDKCEYTSVNPWNVKLHKLTQHLTKEERVKTKYYCETCDRVFISQSFKTKHFSGIRHNNLVTANELQKKVDEDYKLQNSQ